MPDQIREINIHEKIARGTATLADFKNLIFMFLMNENYTKR